MQKGGEGFVATDAAGGCNPVTHDVIGDEVEGGGIPLHDDTVETFGVAAVIEPLVALVAPKKWGAREHAVPAEDGMSNMGTVLLSEAPMLYPRGLAARLLRKGGDIACDPYALREPQVAADRDAAALVGLDATNSCVSG